MKLWAVLVLFLAMMAVTPAFAADIQATTQPAAASTQPAAQFDNQPIRRDAAPGDANAPGKGATAVDSQLNTLNPTRVLLALGAVIALILVLRWCVKKLVPGAVVHRSTNAMKVLSRCAISPKQRLLLVQVGKRLLVIGDGGAQLNPLCQITDSEEVSALLSQVRDESSSIVSRFDSIFGRAKKSFDTNDADAIPDEEKGDVVEEASKPNEIEDSAIAATRDELAGLSDKVRGLAKQLGRA